MMAGTCARQPFSREINRQQARYATSRFYSTRDASDFRTHNCVRRRKHQDDQARAEGCERQKQLPSGALFWGALLMRRARRACPFNGLAWIAAERASAPSPSGRVVQLAAGNSATDHGNSK
jgi:hypothetical protein